MQVNTLRLIIIIILCGLGNLSNTKGCIKPPPPTAKDVSICGSGKTTLNASGGNGRYRWYASPTDTIVLDTTASFSTLLLTKSDTFYLASVNDSCASERDTVVVTVNPLPVANAGKDTGVCPGNFIKLGDSAKAKISYQWSANPIRKIKDQKAIISDSPSVKTQYYLAVKDSITGCKNYDTVSLDIYPVPVAYSIFKIEINNKFIFRAFPKGYAHYYWDFGDVNTGSGDSVTHIYYSKGRYQVTLTVVNSYGCSYVDTLRQPIACDFNYDPTFINKNIITNDPKINIYPNPATNTFTLSTETNIKELTIYNTLGEMVMYVPNYQKNQSINIESLMRGLYLVRGVGENNKEVNVKLIKE